MNTNLNEALWWIQGTTPDFYSFEVAPGMTGGKITAQQTLVDGSAVMGRTISSSEFKGRRVKLTGEVRTNDVTAGAGLWLNATETLHGKVIASNDGFDQAMSGSNNWKSITLETTVPSAADWLNVGVALQGPGQVEVRNLRVEAT